jgi:hypothetical protein
VTAVRIHPGLKTSRTSRYLIHLTLACAIPALLRAAESIAHFDDQSLGMVFAAVRWRLWDWWFWIPVAPLIWRIARRNRASPGSPQALMENGAAFAGLVVLHRAFSLSGMMLFYSHRMQSEYFLFPVPTPNLVLVDLLAYAAIASACVALQRPTGEPIASNGTNRVAESTKRVAEVRRGNHRYSVDLDQIWWIEADGYCSTLHDAAGRHVVRETMASLEARVDARSFFRVHRSAIVNLGVVSTLRQQPRGSHFLQLADGTVVPVTRSKLQPLRERMRTV